MNLLNDTALTAIIKNEIATVEDFPKKGVSFKDMSPLLAKPDVFDAAIMLLSQQHNVERIDVVAGMEARGLVLGAPLAMRMKKPFVMVRKKGKLPNPTQALRYTTEYSEDEIEISTSDLTGKTVLIVDDLLATGGTLEAAIKLFKNAGALKIYTTCLIELADLNGRERLQGSEFSSVLTY